MKKIDTLIYTFFLTFLLSNPVAARETYVGACGGEVTDSQGVPHACIRTDRPVCFDDGSCTCRYDSYCDSSSKNEHEFSLIASKEHQNTIQPIIQR